MYGLFYNLKHTVDVVNDCSETETITNGVTLCELSVRVS